MSSRAPTSLISLPSVRHRVTKGRRGSTLCFRLRSQECFELPVLHKSLSSIHILYNQALVGGHSDSFITPAHVGRRTRIFMCIPTMFTARM